MSAGGVRSGGPLTLAALLAGTPHALRGAPAEGVEVAAIAFDSRQVRPGSLFVAISGVALDGHDYLPQAIAAGASALLVEDAARVPASFTGAVVEVPRARDAFNHCASRFHGDPGLDLRCVAITGTDGKTSVAWMVEAVLAAAGIPTGVIGTVDHHFGDHRWPGETTPPPLALQERLAQLRGLGARAVALEATSQGLSQSRVGSVPLDVAVFTNLSRDHLDYHGSIEDYFAAKARLFSEALAASPKADRHAVINVDTPWGARLRVPDGVRRWSYGQEGSGAELTYAVRATRLEGGLFRLRHGNEEAELALPMLGAFHGANALAAIAVGLTLGGSFQGGVEALRRFRGVPGRAERLEGAGRTVFIDYAHDPDAFEQLLGTTRRALTAERPGARLVTVFGCGGDRDRGKRPLMLAAALRWSDRVVVTSDNPRTEDPLGILADVLAGCGPDVAPERVAVELDRAKAIHAALAASAPADVVMVLGKGHEPYQIVGRERVPYSEHAVVRAALAAVGGG